MSELGAIVEAVLAHYARVRRDLPWRRTRDPYAIWVSEVMLQQTRVATVIPYWERWMARFPTPAALAAAPLDDVLAAWSGLGYYSRARNLQRGARAIAGELPRTAAELRRIPGIGPYTAGAIASIAFGERAPLVDGNVARVLARVFLIEDDIKASAGSREAWRRAGALMDALPAGAAPGDLNQGLMELGATTCTPGAPRCLACPLAAWCGARRTGRQDELPVLPRRKRAAELPVLARDLVWIEEAGELVLARRRAGGLFGGLWELPPRELAERLGARVAGAPVARLEQVLSHRRMCVTVTCATMPPSLVADDDPRYDAIQRVRLSDARRLAVAAATTAILTQYEDTPWSSTPRRSPSSRRATPRSSKASPGSATTPTTRTSSRPRSARRRGSTSSSTTSARSRSK